MSFVQYFTTPARTRYQAKLLIKVIAEHLFGTSMSLYLFVDGSGLAESLKVTILTKCSIKRRSHKDIWAYAKFQSNDTVQSFYVLMRISKVPKNSYILAVQGMTKLSFKRIGMSK